MLKNVKILITLITVIVLGNWLHSFGQVTMKGGRGLWRVLSADVIAPTDIYVNGNFSGYFEKTGPEKLAKFYTLYINGTFGLTKNLELSCNLIAYQDDQMHLLGRMGDSEIAGKLKLPFSSRKVQMAIQPFFKFPTAQVANVPYEVFSTDKMGWGSRALFTFNFSKTTDLPFKVMTNFGYFDHDVTDNFFTSKIDQLLFGFGFKFPIRSQQVYLEYTGEIFINHKDSVDFNNNSNQITIGTKFFGPLNATLDLAADISLAKRGSLSEFSVLHKNYAKWRLWLGITYRFSLFKYFDDSAKLAKKKKEQEQKKLEQIKNRRQKATKDMKEMKEILKKKNPETQ